MDASSFDWFAFSGVQNPDNSVDNNQLDNQSNSQAPASSSRQTGSQSITNYFADLNISNNGNGTSYSTGSRSMSDLSSGLHKNANIGANNGTSVSLNPQLEEPQQHRQKTSQNTSVPFSLSVNQLSPEESKTYLRWYNDITIRKHAKLIKINDVLEFLKNFNLSEPLKSHLKRLFPTNEDLNVGQFFALLRLISHYIYGVTVLKKDVLPSQNLIAHSCQVPKPRSILAKKRVTEEDSDNEENLLVLNNGNTTPIGNPFNNTGNAGDGKIDLDSFAKFIMTGERPANKNSQSPINKGKKKKKAKKVKFSDQLVTVASTSIDDSYVSSPPPSSASATVGEATNTQPSNKAGDRNSLDLSLPMDQLLQKLKNNPNEKHQIPVRNFSDKEVEDEEEILGENFKHFQNVNIESALVHGKTAAIPQELVPTNTGGTMDVGKINPGFNQPLQPTLTGSANHFLKQNHAFGAPTNTNNNDIYFNGQNGAAFIGNSFNQTQGHISPNGLSPNNTSTGGVNGHNALSSLGNLRPQTGGSLSPAYISPQPSGLQGNGTGGASFANTGMLQQPQPQPLQYNQQTYHLSSLGTNNLRVGSLSPQPSPSPGDQFINSLTGKMPPPPPPRSRSNSASANLNITNHSRGPNIPQSTADLTTLNNFPAPPSSRSTGETQSSGAPPSLPPKITLSPSEVLDNNFPHSQQFQPGRFQPLSQFAYQQQQQQQQAPQLPSTASFQLNKSPSQFQLQFTGGVYSNSSIASPLGSSQFAEANPLVGYGMALNSGVALDQYGNPSPSPISAPPVPNKSQEDLEWFERD